MSSLVVPKWDDLIGVPFAYGGRTDKVLDCYGLLMLLEARRGNAIPDFKSSDNSGVNAANFAFDTLIENGDAIAHVFDIGQQMAAQQHGLAFVFQCDDQVFDFGAAQRVET